MRHVPYLIVKETVAEHRCAGINPAPSPEVGESTARFLDEHDERCVVPRPTPEMHGGRRSAFGNEQGTMTQG